mmetsp:Transcript_23504/g.39627  ORF Transcript_23504/g.39627 Transcript_23504/m.39627 type:complete len:1095 (+) Transcript_23504:37-3321(+)
MATHGRRAGEQSPRSAENGGDERPKMLRRGTSVILRPIKYGAVLFAVDGVLAATGKLHEVSWKSTLDEYLKTRQDVHHEPFFEFEHSDYQRYIEGLERFDGLRTFLASRKINIPEGTPEDQASQETICGLANKKHRKFQELVDSAANLRIYQSTVALIKDLREKGIKVGAVSMSSSSERVLQTGGVLDLLDLFFDKKTADAEGLKGFPEPDIWTKAAQKMGFTPENTIVVDESSAGCQGGRKGEFALVVGLARTSNHRALRQAGAHVTITDFKGYGRAENLQKWMETKDVASVQKEEQEGAESMQTASSMYGKMDLFSSTQEWCIVEDSYVEQVHQLNETIFCLANGFLAMRGNFEEGFKGAMGNSVPGIYMNGFFESSPIKYAEAAYGYPEKHQTMLNLTSSRKICAYIGDTAHEDAQIGMWTGEVSDYRRVLDLGAGTVTRSFTWEDHEERVAKVETQHLVSFIDKNLAVMKYTITPENFDETITLVSNIDGNVTNVITKNDPRVGSALSGQVLHVIHKTQEQNGLFATITQRTTYSNLVMVCGMKNVIETKCDYTVEGRQVDQCCEALIKVQAKKGEPITIIKYITYHNSRDIPDSSHLIKAAGLTLNRGCDDGLKYWLSKQSAFLKQFWEQSNVSILGDPGLQQGVRFNMFHLLQSVGRDGKTNIGAKGLTGEGYEGHYFWDTEIYMIPFFLYTMPDIVRKLLEFRFNTLDGARARAKELAHKGALYPWRTIMGDEASAFFPAGTAQYHINADIIHSLRKYMEATDDMEFLTTMGAEMLFETARFWVDIGNYRESDNKFVINCVTGPDEYTACVNNNCFTNFMAQANLQYAVDVSIQLKSSYADDYKRLVDKLGLQEGEVKEWGRAAECMFFPYDDTLGIYCQDDSFIHKEKWDIKGTPKNKFPLLLNFHPLSIYRKQVCKQADLLLAEYLLGDKFSQDQKKRDYEYYEKITTHDSSLSACVFAILAAELGMTENAYHHFTETARMDLDNHHRNTQHGIHTAAMAGTWISLTGGFAGMRAYNGKLQFNPWLPAQWQGDSFNITFKNSGIKIDVAKGNVTYTLKSGSGLSFTHKDNNVVLSPESPTVTRSL